VEDSADARLNPSSSSQKRVEIQQRVTRARIVDDKLLDFSELDGPSGSGESWLTFGRFAPSAPLARLRRAPAASGRTRRAGEGNCEAWHRRPFAAEPPASTLTPPGWRITPRGSPRTAPASGLPDRPTRAIGPAPSVTIPASAREAPTQPPALPHSAVRQALSNVSLPLAGMRLRL